MLHGAETILVVEDQDQLRKMVVRVLRSHGYTVCEAEDPEKALRHSERYAQPIHLLLTDVVMPGMSGRELAGQLKPLRPDMKIIFMSGYSEHAMLNRQMLESAAYLAKPFSPQDLAVKVRQVLAATRPAGAIVIADGEPGVRKFLSGILTGEGYRVLEAKNGREAIHQVENSAVDLLIVDLATPGREAIEGIQSLLLRRPRVKVIAISDKAADSVSRLAELPGAHALLTKPIQPDELLDSVARLMAG
jgi:hypothetical protein